MFKSNRNPQFRSKFSEDIFYVKYAHKDAETLNELACTLVEDVCQSWLTKDEKEELIDHISNLRFLPGGRYLYYAGRDKKFFNNCYLLKAEEDTREDWANLSWKSESCLMTGGGIGCDYSIYRPEGQTLRSTGGMSSGPLPKMMMINEIGRRVMQGGSRRSAIYASLNWEHGDVHNFLTSKNWKDMPVGSTGQSIFDIKQDDFDFPAPLDMTNISVNYDTKWLLNFWETGEVGDVFKENVKQALSTAEPGFSFNFFEKENETLRNACTEVTSEDDSDVCNLSSLNFLGLMILTSCKVSYMLPQNSFYVGLYEHSFPMTRFSLSGRRTGVLDWDSWVYMNGSSREAIDMRLLQSYIDGSRYMKRNQIELPKNFQTSYLYLHQQQYGPWLPQEPLVFLLEPQQELNQYLQLPTNDVILKINDGITSM